MSLAPVIDLATARRRILAQRLLNLGVPLKTITATRTDAELDALHNREQIIAELVRLTGHRRHVLNLWDTPELLEMHHACLRSLMGAPSSRDDRLIYSIPGRVAPTRQARRQQANKAWGISA